MAQWMPVNSEAVHGTRPWAVFGEGPTETSDGAFQERAVYTARDIRFTSRDDKVYAITLGEPKQTVVITSLGSGAGHLKRPVRRCICWA